MSECHIAAKAATGEVCACQGEPDIVLVVKHHHEPDGGCGHATVTMCHHHYAHYLRGMAELVLTALFTGDHECSRCGESFREAADIFERVS